MSTPERVWIRHGMDVFTKCVPESDEYVRAERERAENAKLRSDLYEALTALKLGGHLRPDGSVCSYSGSPCNKCGYIDRSPLAEENALLKRSLAMLSETEAGGDEDE